MAILYHSVSQPLKIINNFNISIIFRSYFKSVLLVIVVSVCGFYKYLTNEKHSKELVTKPRNAIESSNCQSNVKVQGLFIRHILNYTGYNQK